MQKLFRYPKTFSTLKGFPRKLLALWDKKFSREKRDTTIMRNFSRYHIFSWNSAAINTKFFVTVRPNLFNGKMFYAELFIRKNFAKPEFFSKTEGFLYKNFRHCETNNFRRKCVTPFMHKIFCWPQTFWNIEGLPTISSALSDVTLSTEKRLYP